MKIGICVRSWEELGGIGVYTRNIVTNLLNLDQKNQYFLFFANKESLGKFSDYQNVREVYVPSKGKLMWDQAAIPWYAKKVGVDVIFHTKLTIPVFTCKKTLMVLHGTERFLYSDFHPKSDRLYFRTIYPQFLKRASAIIAVSERARQDIIKLVSIEPEKVKTIYLAVDPIFRVIKSESYLDQIRKKYKLPTKFVVYVGHIYPGKNMGRLFKAFARVRKKHDIRLVVAGAMRWKYNEDMEFINSLNLENSVHLLGYVPHDDLVGLYNLAEMTAFPSYYESFPAIPLEANACGCPVVTSRTGGTPESAGDAAVYVDPMEVDDITGAILHVLENKDLRNDLVQKGFKNVKRFSWHKTAQKTLAVLESLILQE